MKEVSKSYWYHRLSRFLRHATPERWENLVMAQAQYLLGASHVHGLPPLMYIDPINYCILHCPLCPTGQGVLGRKKGKMSFDLFKRLVDEIAHKVCFLNLYNWGEPLLHPQIFDMVEYATSKGISVRISSNLNRLTPGQANLMVESGLEELLVDLDGATQETYEKYRVGGNLASVIENIRSIVSAKKNSDVPFPLITARVLLTKFNQSEIHQIRTLAWGLGVDRFWVAPVYVDLKCPDDIEKWVTGAGRTKKDRPRGQPHKCDQLWRNLTISWDGGVFPCCWFHEQEHDFGNVSDGGDLVKTWNNECFIQSRLFVAGKVQSPPNTMCGQCKGYPEYHYSYSSLDKRYRPDGLSG